MSRARETPAPLRGEIWMVDFGTPIGHEQGYRRPAVVVSADRLNRSRADLAIVVPMTRTRCGLPSHIEVEPGESGLREVSYAKCEDVKSVSIERLTRRVGLASPTELRGIVQVIVLLVDG
ncbi:MAG: type II toxin-antitoxin system PemK/MazF family toxin [Pseudonocardia sp.]